MPDEKVTLRRFRIRTYRSCKDTEFSPTEAFTALIWPNGVGKTNIMHAILLLSLSGRSRYYSNQDDLFASHSDIEAYFLYLGKRIQYKLSLTYGQNDSPRDQVVVADEQWNFRSLTGVSKWIKDEVLKFHTNRLVLHHDYYVGRIIQRGLVKTFRATRSKRATNVRRLSKKPSKDEIAAYDAIQTFRLGIRYYSASQFTNPSLSPTSFEIDEEEEGKLVDLTQTRRLPHTRFIYDLYRASKSSESSYEAFISIVGKAGVRLIDENKWETVNISSETYEVRTGGRLVPKTRNRIVVIPIVHVGSSQLSFNQLSEGTLRTLAMLFYIITEKCQLLLLEEPEVCVHHGLLKSVIEIIKEYSSKKQIVISTHSESVLDNLSPEQIRVVERPEETGTVIQSLNKVTSRDELKALRSYLSAVGGLGEYWRLSGFR